MVNNLMCDACRFEEKCTARAKLKPFLEDARVDLRVELTFNNCADYQVSDDAERVGEIDPEDEEIEEPY
jgi:hypothetical protein